MDPLNNISNSGNNISVALENPKIKGWFEHVVALLRTLPHEEGIASSEDLKKHVITIHNAIHCERQKEMSEEVSKRIAILFHQVFSGEKHLDHLNKANRLFESGEFGRLIPLNVNPNTKLKAFDKAFIRKWIVPKMFQAYPDIKQFGRVDAVANWVVNVLASTTSKFELESLKDRIDGIPMEVAVDKVAIRKLLMRNFTTRFM